METFTGKMWQDVTMGSMVILSLHSSQVAHRADAYRFL